MERHKFSIGQSVKVAVSDRWVGDYDAPGDIISFGSIILNGLPTYDIKLHNRDLLYAVSENRIKAY